MQKNGAEWKTFFPVQFQKLGNQFLTLHIFIQKKGISEEIIAYLIPAQFD